MADVAVDHAEWCDDRGLVRRDAVETAHWTFVEGILGAKQGS